MGGKTEDGKGMGKREGGKMNWMGRESRGEEKKLESRDGWID